MTTQKYSPLVCYKAQNPSFIYITVVTKKNHTSSLWLVDFIIVCREITILGTCSMSTDVGSRGTCQVHGSALLAQLFSHKVVSVTTTTTPTEPDC
jgi:hypothetical protein